MLQPDRTGGGSLRVLWVLLGLRTTFTAERKCKRTMRTARSVFTTVALFAVGMLGLGAVLGSVGGSAPTEAAPPPVAEAPTAAPEIEAAPLPPDSLRADIRITGAGVFIRNLNDYEWRDCQIAVNPRLLDSGWTQRVARVTAGAEVAGGLAAFTNGEGARFNPDTHSVKAISVVCAETPVGLSSVYGIF